MLRRVVFAHLCPADARVFSSFFSSIAYLGRRYRAHMHATLRPNTLAHRNSVQELLALLLRLSSSASSHAKKPSRRFRARSRSWGVKPLRLIAAVISLRVALMVSASAYGGNATGASGVRPQLLEGGGSPH